MPLLTLTEASIYSGYSPELLQYFSKNCPKYNENKKLNFQTISDLLHFDESDLKNYIKYLKEPWPVKDNATRAYIPDAIKDDIKKESHFQCAICGHMDNGEIAHIEPYKQTLNNSPDNLIFLCPNHHSKYDYGHKLSSNITTEVIWETKKIKRESRKRILRYENNAIKELSSIIQYIKKLQKDIEQSEKADVTSIQINELKNIMTMIPNITSEALEEAKKDKDSSISQEILLNAPKISKFSFGINQTTTAKEIINASTSIVNISNQIVIDIDEVDCPHCNGRGQIGLVGNICAYCKGSCVVTQEDANTYKREDLDEVDCPHCNGRGQTGLVGDICAYCNGSCVVTQEDFDKYKREDLDEVDCPHCNGSGQTGLVGDICSYCNGSCVVTQEDFDKYKREDLDEVDCPHCNGSGQTGLVGDLCSLCKGSQSVSKALYTAYNKQYGNRR